MKIKKRVFCELQIIIIVIYYIRIPDWKFMSFLKVDENLRKCIRVDSVVGVGRAESFLKVFQNDLTFMHLERRIRI